VSPHDLKVFGSPVYVLDKALQDGLIGPGKWKKRCYQGVYIGHSPHHASNVILVYNPKTWLVSPQYHVVHDESFDTVQIDKMEAEAAAQLDAMMDDLFQTSRWQHSDVYTDHESPFATHQYLGSSWDLAVERAQASSQSEHDSRQSGISRKRARDSSSTSETSVSEGA
jgi:hypothetical protein